MLRHCVLLFGIILLVGGSCSPLRFTGRTSVTDRFLDNPAVSDSHVGFTIYDPENREYLYEHNSYKSFVPASNIKFFTLYAGLRYLDEGIPGIQYLDYNDTLYLRATGDPTFLLQDFPDQPVMDFLKKAGKPLAFIRPGWKTEALGYGWPWNFYLNYYMAERSPFPVYGNVIIWAQREMAGLDKDVNVTYVMSHPHHGWPVEIRGGENDEFEVNRPVTENIYTVYPGFDGDREIFVPFATKGMEASLELLRDTLGKAIKLIPDLPHLYLSHEFPETGHNVDLPATFQTLYSRPADSLFRPMMLYSDNFFAEQTLMMVSQKLTGVMDEKELIGYLLENDLRNLPRKPIWVDGSGLSRYNLASPRSIVWLLEKMGGEFGYERVSRLLPTGGEGTLEEFYLEEKGRIYAKTGTLGNNAVALSGYLLTVNGRTLVFSVLVNNHDKESAQVRIAVQDFLKEIIYRH